MVTGHDRRLDRLEEAATSKGRTKFVWDDHKPGSVDLEIELLAHILRPIRARPAHPEPPWRSLRFSGIERN
jgi:hypothetical protein